MAGHFIVCGMGHIGYRIVDLLRRMGESVTVITQSASSEWVRAAQAQGVHVIFGDARDGRLLSEAGIQSAQGLIAATDQDLVNVEIMLDAKQQRPGLPVVVRLFDQTLAHRLEASFDVRRALAVSALAAPPFVAAAMGETVVGSFTMNDTLFVIGRLTLNDQSPLAGQTVEQAGERHGLAILTHQRRRTEASSTSNAGAVLSSGDELTVVAPIGDWERAADGSKTQSKSPQPPHQRSRRREQDPAGFRRMNRAWQIWRHVPVPLRAVFVTLILLMALSLMAFRFVLDLSWVDALYFLVTTVTTTGYGDINLRDASAAMKIFICFVMLLGSATIAVLYSIITDFVVTARFQQMFGRQRIPREGHVIVVGLGNVGYRIVDELRRSAARVVAIEHKSDGEFVAGVRAHTPVIIGDARLPETLMKAGADRASAVIAATSDDAVNLSVGLSAHQLNAHARTVVRLFDADFAHKVQSTLDIDVALSASRIAAPTFVAAVLHSDVRHAFLWGDRLIILIHRAIDEAWHGLTPVQLRARYPVLVLMRPGATDRRFYVVPEDERLAKGERVLAVMYRELLAS